MSTKKTQRATATTSDAKVKRLTQERNAEKARADAAEKRLADLRAWAKDEDAWDGYHVGDVIDEILRQTAPEKG